MGAPKGSGFGGDDERRRRRAVMDDHGHAYRTRGRGGVATEAWGTPWRLNRRTATRRRLPLRLCEEPGCAGVNLTGSETGWRGCCGARLCRAPQNTRGGLFEVRAATVFSDSESEGLTVDRQSSSRNVPHLDRKFPEARRVRRGRPDPRRRRRWGPLARAPTRGAKQQVGEVKRPLRRQVQVPAGRARPSAGRGRTCPLNREGEALFVDRWVTGLDREVTCSYLVAPRSP